MELSAIAAAMVMHCAHATHPAPDPLSGPPIAEPSTHRIAPAIPAETADEHASPAASPMRTTQIKRCPTRGKPLCVHTAAHHPPLLRRAPLQTTPVDDFPPAGIDYPTNGATDGDPVLVVRPSNRAPQGFTLNFFVYGDLTPDAESALQLTADYYALVIQSPIEVNLNVHLSQYGLGGAFPTLVEVPYPQFRNALRRNADADDVLPDYLPAGSVPARRELGGPIVQENTVAMSSANAKILRLIDDDGGIDGEMFIGNVADGNPADGIGNGAGTGYYATFSLVDVLVHEVAHTLGFFNAFDVGLASPTTLDLFRFARTGPDNPETLEDFTTFPRALYLGGAELERQHNFDFIVREHAASNGILSQPSHFEEHGAFPDRVGVMDPGFDPYETGYPFYFSQGDLDALDAIGYEITTLAPPIPCNTADIADPVGVVDLNDIVAFVSAFNAGLPEADLAEPPQLHDLGDVVAFVTAFALGCD